MSTVKIEGTAHPNSCKRGWKEYILHWLLRTFTKTHWYALTSVWRICKSLSLHFAKVVSKNPILQNCSMLVTSKIRCLNISRFCPNSRYIQYEINCNQKCVSRSLLRCEAKKCQTDCFILVACLVDLLVMVFLVWYVKIATLLKWKNKLVQNLEQL